MIRSWAALSLPIKCAVLSVVANSDLYLACSKKLVAEAFCEAVLLAQIREEQWSGMPVKQRRKEIYVLVRNLRSSAYRLALATVVLEQEEEDVVFL